MAAPALRSPNPLTRARAAKRAGYISPRVIRANPLLRTTTSATATPAAASGAGTLTSLIKQYQASLLSPAQQRQMAEDSVRAQINLALAGYRATTAADQKYANQQATRAQGFAEAINSLGRTNAAEIASLYNDASGRVQGLGTGLTGAVGAAEAAQAKQTQDAVAQATGGLGHVGGYDTEGLRNISQYTGVIRPATDLAGEAANQGAFAAYNTGANAQHVTNIAQDYLAKAAEDQHALALQRAALESTRPDLYTKALESVQTGNRSDMATIIQALALQNTYGNTASEIAARTAGTKQGAARTGATVASASGKTPAGAPKAGNYFVGAKNTAAKIPDHYKLDESDPTFHTIIPDPNNPPSGMIYDRAKGMFVPKPSPGSKPKATSASAVTTIGNNIGKVALGPPFSRNTTDAISKSLGDPDVYKPLMTWQRAYTSLLNRFPEDVRKTQRAKQYVIDALLAAGYKQP